MTTAVTVTKSFTRNVGNFESARTEYGITTDDYLDGETTEQLRLRLKAAVERWVQEDVKEIDADLGR